MAKRKFKIGDRVKVVKETGIKSNKGHGVKIGREGKVVECDISCNYLYQVQFRGRIGKKWFITKELELINRKGNK